MSHIDHILQEAKLVDEQNFRSFSCALAGIIREQGYDGDEQDRKAAVRFLYAKYRQAGVPFNRDTLKSWFSGTSRPLFGKNCRDGMFELCFALSFDYHQVRDFFEHVYLSRAFNCRNIQEAAYCYSFSRRLDYQRACCLHVQGQGILKSPGPSPDREAILYTSDMEQEILTLESEEEFLNYVREHKKSFQEYSQSARRELQRLLGRTKGSRHDQELINLHRKKHSEISARECEELEGLAVREYFLYHESCRDLKGQHVASADFMLSQILGIRLEQYYVEEGTSFSRDARLNPLAKINFPSSQSLSDILTGKKYASFDSVRKMIILLHFYDFFVSADLEDDQKRGYSAYLDDAADQLYAAGYAPLYAGSPYDRIFMDSAKNSRPLDYFRALILEAVETE